MSQRSFGVSSAIVCATFCHSILFAVVRYGILTCQSSISGRIAPNTMQAILKTTLICLSRANQAEFCFDDLHLLQVFDLNASHTELARSADKTSATFDSAHLHLPIEIFAGITWLSRIQVAVHSLID